MSDQQPGKVFPAPPLQRPATRFPLGLKQELFWTLSLAIIGGTFTLGLLIGGAKFDKDKADYYENIKMLTKDTSDLHKTIAEKDSILLKKDSTIHFYRDSLDYLYNDEKSLYQVLGEYMRKTGELK